jgi:4-diphosphocytidyl-2-C-methyl-D-erythritol kinase
MVSFPPCKINLGLQVIEKRPDGFHNLETCFYTIPWTDVLEIVPSQKLSFNITGDAIPGDPKDNLCVKAYRLLADQYKLPPVDIHLHKIIPTGAGLGGGSSDAAHTLRLLNVLFDLNIDDKTLSEFASRLGSDCAFFIQDKPMIGRGRGEILTNALHVSIARKFLVIVKPAVHVSTAEAYAGIVPNKPGKSVESILGKPIQDWRGALINDFEQSVFAKYPVIKSIKETLYREGATYASMSGSGAAVFGIFDHAVDLKDRFERCVYWSGTIKA